MYSRRKELNLVDNYKTYILVILLLIVGVLHSMQFLTNEVAGMLYAILGPLAVATMRHALAKLQASNEKTQQDVEKFEQSVEKLNGQI